jgi:hypothetical protein
MSEETVFIIAQSVDLGGIFWVTENRRLSIGNKTSNQMDGYETSNWDRDRKLCKEFPVGCAIMEMEYSQRKTPWDETVSDNCRFR